MNDDDAVKLDAICSMTTNPDMLKALNECRSENHKPGINHWSRAAFMAERQDFGIAKEAKWWLADRAREWNEARSGVTK